MTAIGEELVLMEELRTMSKERLAARWRLCRPSMTAISSAG